MKILITSDIHGDYKNFNKVLSNESFDKIIVLGDLLDYKDINNNLIDNNIITLLRKLKDKLILIKGNCDYNINFESLGLFAHEIITLFLNNHYITITHGNKFSRGFLPTYHGDIFVSGHIHIPNIIKENNIIYVNPGSIGKPRNGSLNSYAIFDENKIVIKTVMGKPQKEINI